MVYRASTFSNSTQLALRPKVQFIQMSRSQLTLIDSHRHLVVIYVCAARSNTQKLGCLGSRWHISPFLGAGNCHFQGYQSSGTQPMFSPK